jgi:ADP-heptose:LPS heptosyltransferase
MSVTSREGPDTILIFRIGSLGDTVVALPCFHLIARSFPDLRRIVVTNSPASEKVAPVESVLGGSGLIHGTIYFPPSPRKLRDLLSLRNRIRQSKATTLIYVADRRLAMTLRDIYFFRACGIQNVIGAPISRDSQLLRHDPLTGDTEREAERLARCLSVLGPIDLDDPGMWDLRLQPDELHVADAALASLQGRDFVAISLGGKDRAKDWGNDNWSALLSKMGGRYAEMAMVFIGSSDEFERCAGIAAHWSGLVMNLCGRLAPRGSAAVMRRASFYIGHDCGPMHLAAAVGIPCVAMFGPLNMPKWWHPTGPRHRIIHNMRDIREITPDTVLAAVDALVSEVPSRASDRMTA